MAQPFRLINNGVRVAKTRVFRQTAGHYSVLLMSLAHMGDLILALPAILRLKGKIKNCEMDIIVGDYNVELAKSFHIFRDIYVYNFFQVKSSAEPARIAAAEETLLKGLKNYDLAIDLRRSPDTRFLLGKINATIKAGFTTFSELDEQLDVCLPTEDPNYEFGKAKKHNSSSISLQLMQLVEALPIESISQPRIGRDVSKQEAIAIFPCAGQELKEWPLHSFVRLTEQILKDRLFGKVNVYLSKDERSRALYFTEIRDVEVHIGLEFEELAQSLAANQIVISNNSFGAHVGSLLNIPVVGIYGGHETFVEWQPVFNENAIIYSDMNCSPCHIGEARQCPYDLLCLRQITVDDVLKVIVEIKTNLNPMQGDDCRTEDLSEREYRIAARSRLGPILARGHGEASVHNANRR